MGVVELVARAGAVVRDRYARRDLAVEYKGPNDPVTEADRAANELLCEGLSKLLPGAQVIAEETASEVDDPSRADLTFFVDPLDGTRDFVERTGEFSVMVGLVEGAKAVLGVVGDPMRERTFAAAEGVGAFVLPELAWGARRAIHVSERRERRGATLLVSRSRPSPRLARIGASLEMTSLPVGSAGVKGARVACGEAEAFVHLGTCGYLWDIAAIDALARSAGGRVTNEHGAPIAYRQRELRRDDGVVLSNGHVHDALLAAIGCDP